MKRPERDDEAAAEDFRKIVTEVSKKVRTGKRGYHFHGLNESHASIGMIAPTRKDLAEHRQREDDRIRTQRAAAVEAFERTGHGYNVLTDKALKSTCRHYNLACTGDRIMLLARLVAHSRGLVARKAESIHLPVTAEEQAIIPTLEGPKKVTKTFAMAMTATLDTLDLNVLAKHLMVYITDPRDILACRLVCRHLVPAATAQALALSKKLYPAGGGTLLSLAVHAKLRKAIDEKAGTPAVKKACKMLRILAKHIYPTVHETKSLYERFAFIPYLRHAQREELVSHAMQVAFVEHGSIEGLKAKQIARVQDVALKKTEAEIIYEGAHERLAALNVAFRNLDSTGIYPVFDESFIPALGSPDRLRLALPGCLIMHYVRSACPTLKNTSNDYHDGDKSPACRSIRIKLNMREAASFVLKKNPKTPVGVLNWLTGTLWSTAYTGIASLAAGLSNYLTLEKPEDLTEPRQREILARVLFFCDALFLDNANTMHRRAGDYWRDGVCLPGTINPSRFVGVSLIKWMADTPIPQEALVDHTEIVKNLELGDDEVQCEPDEPMLPLFRNKYLHILRDGDLNLVDSRPPRKKKCRIATWRPPIATIGAIQGEEMRKFCSIFPHDQFFSLRWDAVEDKESVVVLIIENNFERPSLRLEGPPLFYGRLPLRRPEENSPVKTDPLGYVHSHYIEYADIDRVLTTIKQRKPLGASRLAVNEGYLLSENKIWRFDPCNIKKPVKCYHGAVPVHNSCRCVSSLRHIGHPLVIHLDKPPDPKPGVAGKKSGKPGEKKKTAVARELEESAEEEKRKKKKQKNKGG